MLPCVIHTGQWSYSKALHQVLWLLVGFLPNQFPQKIQSCKIFSAFSISLEGRWAFPLLYSRGQGCPGVQGKGESSDDGDEDLEHFALTCQCLAEVWFNFGWAILPFLADWMPHHGRLFMYIVQWLDLIEKSGRAQSNWKSKFTALTPGGTKPLFVRLLITIVRLLNLLFANGSPLFLHSDAHQSIKLGRNCKLCKYALQQCSCTRLKFAQT